MSLVVVGSIIFTVIAGLMLSQLDYLELPYLLPTVQAVAGNELIIDVTDTPLPAIPLPSEAPTSTATNTVVASPTSAETAVTESISCNQAPSFWVRYIVQPGDTLSSLSSLYGLTSGEIALANCLQAGQSLMSGMAIKLPWSWIQSPTCIAPLTWVQYQVMPGDTLYSLAIKRGTTIQDVMNANCLFSSNDLFFGKTILLPPLVMTPVMPTVTLTPTATITATASATAVTQTPTPSTTWTPTATATIVFSPTVTATPTGTWIETPTSTATSTATDTPSGTPTSTPTSMTGTVTATPTETNTPISSATPPPTLPATEIPTSVPTETATPLPTALPTNTAVPTETPVSP